MEVQAAPGGMAAAARAIADGEITSADLTERSIAAITEHDRRIGAFVVVLESALAEARERDAERARGVLRGPLHGVPVAVKDLIDVAGAVTTAGSPKLATNLARSDATVVARLRAAGAVILGKTRTHEFAYGVLTPGTSNPWDERRIAGGSSGGSAAAVAAGFVPAALGTDTAGSVRIPAACCGVVGFKPTLGRVPTTGVWPLSWSCDTVGVLVRGADDAALAFAGMTGRPVRAVARTGTPRLGWLVGEEVEQVAPGVAAALAALRARLDGAGVRVDDVELPLAAARAAVSAMVLPEVAAAHERLLAETGERGYSPAMLAALRIGQSALAVEYLRGLRYRGRFAALVDGALAGRDALVLPTVPVPAPEQGRSVLRLGDRELGVQEALTALPGAFNCSGSPVVSLPVGLSDGLPVAASLVGRAGEDAELLELAMAVESVAPRIGRPPAGTPAGF
ncbi:MAG TPA: amidase [Actinomycetes bacterium]|nr:amidase [Actinomycetes bacterium]